MKNTIRLLRIIAFATVICFSMIACGDGSGDGGNDDGTGITLGQETMSVFSQQVYTVVQNGNGSFSYPAYTGANLTLNDGFTPPLGVALISGGKFTYTQTGAPTGSVLENISDWFDYVVSAAFTESVPEDISDWLDNVTISPADTQCAVIDVFSTDSKDYYLDRVNYTSNINVSTNTVTITIEDLMYVYVNKDVTITADKLGPITINPSNEEYTLNAVNLSLTKGWNEVTIKVVSTVPMSVPMSKITSTISLTKGDTGRWVLSDRYKLLF